MMMFSGWGRENTVTPAHARCGEMEYWYSITVSGHVLYYTVSEHVLVILHLWAAWIHEGATGRGAFSLCVSWSCSRTMERVLGGCDGYVMHEPPPYNTQHT